MNLVHLANYRTKLMNKHKKKTCYITLDEVHEYQYLLDSKYQVRITVVQFIYRQFKLRHIFKSDFS